MQRNNYNRKHVYTLEAGRSIVRDGLPFAYIAQSKAYPGAPYIEPCDLDAFARLAAAAPALLEALDECITSGDATCYNGTDATRLENMAKRLRAINEAARAAIAKVQS